MRIYLKLLAIVLFLSPGFAFAGAGKVEKIATGTVVKVSRAGAVLKLKEGDQLESGDELSTDATTAVDLRLADETLIRIGVNSSYRVQELSKLRTMVHRLISGAVRVLVKPSEGDKKEAAAIKFRMTTPEGTIGVRGTEFVVLSGGGKTEVKGLDGEVIFGAGDTDFANGKDFVIVTRGFRSSIKSGAKSAAKPEKYDLKAYLDELSEKRGVFGPLASRVNGNNHYVRDNSVKTADSGALLSSAKAPIAENREVLKGKKSAKESGKPDYQNMLLKAAQDGDEDVATLALKNGADVNGRGSVGHTALHIAMLNNKQEMFSFLIEKGANVEAEDEFGLRPLMFVAENKLDFEFAEALVLPGGADFKATNRNGQTALDIAKANNYKKLVDYLSSDKAESDLKQALASKRKR